MSSAAGRLAAERRGLVVGFGNVLRTDDGVGFVVVQRLEADPRLVNGLASGRLRVFWSQQLLPELAVDFAEADVVVLVDANAGLSPGEIRVEAVETASAGAGDAAGSGAGMTHHVDAGTLGAMARDLFGGSPVVWVVGVGPESMELGEALTPTVEAAVPEAVETVVRLLGGAVAR